MSAFDAGKSRSESIDDANKKYAELWGADKVIPMNNFGSGNKG